MYFVYLLLSTLIISMNWSFFLFSDMKFLKSTYFSISHYRNIFPDICFHKANEGLLYNEVKEIIIIYYLFRSSRKKPLLLPEI